MVGRDDGKVLAVESAARGGDGRVFEYVGRERDGKGELLSMSASMLVSESISMSMLVGR